MIRRVLVPVPPPTRLHLEVTNRCNSLCPTCVRTFAPDPGRDMRVDQIERLAAELPGLRTVALQVNGEPLLHPELPAIVRLFKRRGVTVELNTNGLTLCGPAGRGLLAAAPDKLNVSLDALSPATYASLRGVDAVGRVIDNLRGFLAARGPGAAPRASLWTVATRRGLPDLPRLVELAAEIGAEEVYLQRLVVHRFAGEAGDGAGGISLDGESLHGRLDDAGRATLARAHERAAELGVTLQASGGHPPAAMLTPEPVEAWRSCRRPWESAVVLADGSVVPCCISTFVAPREDIVMGNAFTEGLLPVWTGRAYHSFRAQMLTGERPVTCRCGDRWSL